MSERDDAEVDFEAVADWLAACDRRTRRWRLISLSLHLTAAIVFGWLASGLDGWQLGALVAGLTLFTIGQVGTPLPPPPGWSKR